jgi:hypothetical protein
VVIIIIIIRVIGLCLVGIIWIGWWVRVDGIREVGIGRR